MLLLLSTTLLLGCLSRPNAARDDANRQPEPAVVLGTVLYVDPVQNLAVIELRSPVRVPPVRLYSRNLSLQQTSLMEASAQQRGRTLGSRILSGLPNQGDEVLLFIEPESEAETDS